MPVPAPAQDLYISDGFRKRRQIAEAVSEAWFVLSAEHGLVSPDEWLAPYDLALRSTSAEYREQWGRWCVARLVRKLGPLKASRVLILAPAAYADAVRGPLEELGAITHEPLVGLPMGDQLAWLTRMARPLPGLPDPGPSIDRSVTLPSSSVEANESATDHMIADALAAYRDDHATPKTSRLGFALTVDGDEMLRKDPFAFLIAVIFDEGIKAERAWEAPLLLKQRLGHFDPSQLRYDLDAIRAAVQQKPALHRYREIIPVAVQRAAERVCIHYDGDAGRIWSDGSTAADVEQRLLAFHRIGPKKAAMAVELRISHFGANFRDLHGTNVAYDVHVRRVFLRTGLVDTDSIEAVTAAARRLTPDRPGYIDFPTWLIGRQWCRPTNPLCPGCPLTDVCRKLTTRNVLAS